MKRGTVLRVQRRAAKPVYPYGQRGSVSAMWWEHRDKLSKPPEQQRRVGFVLRGKREP